MIDGIPLRVTRVRSAAAAAAVVQVARASLRRQADGKRAAEAQYARDEKRTHYTHTGGRLVF